MRQQFPHRLFGHVPAAAELLRVSLKGNLAVIAVFVLVPVTGLGALTMPSWAVHRISAPLWHGVASPLALERLPGRVLDAGATLGASENLRAAQEGLELPRPDGLRRAKRTDPGAGSGWGSRATHEPNGPAIVLPANPLGPPRTPSPGDTASPSAVPTDAGSPKAPADASARPSPDSVEAPPAAPGSPHDPTASDPESPLPPPPADEGDSGPPPDGGQSEPPSEESSDAKDGGPSDDPDDDAAGKPDKPEKPAKPDKPENGSPNDTPGHDKPAKPEKPEKPDDQPAGSSAEDKPGNGPPEDKPGNGPPEDKPGNGPPEDKPDKADKDRDHGGGPDVPGDVPHPGNGKKGGRRRRNEADES